MGITIQSSTLPQVLPKGWTPGEVGLFYFAARILNASNFARNPDTAKGLMLRRSVSHMTSTKEDKIGIRRLQK